VELQHPSGWKPDQLPGNSLVTDQLILIGTDKSCAPGSLGHLYAFDRRTGSVRWKYRTSGIPTDIARIGSKVYAATLSDQLVALNLADGGLRWTFGAETPNPDCELPSSPVIIGDRVFYAGLNGVLYSLDGESGKVLWKRDLGKRTTTKLSVVGNSLYLGDSTKRLLRISADDGQIQGELAMPATPQGRIVVAEDSGLYLFLEDRESRAGYLVSTDFNLSRVRWTQKSDRAWSSEWPRLWHGLLLAGTCRGQLNALRVSDGAPQWSDKLKGCLRSIGTDGDEEQFYVGAQEGTVYAYSPPANSGSTK